MEIIQQSPISILIIAITVITSYQAFNDRNLLNKTLLYPYQMVRDNSWYRFISSGFVHADLTHLAFNMISFYGFGMALESIMGSIPFLIFYIAALIISDLSSVWRHKDNPQYRALGASGGVSAVILACVLYNPDMRLGLMFVPIPIPGWLFAIIYMGYSHYASKQNRDNIGHEAHLWGGIAGIILGLTMSETIRESFLFWLHNKGIL